MNIDIDVKDINRTHRIGAKPENKRRPIIVKFVRYSERCKVFNSKKRLKGKKLSKNLQNLFKKLTESLTKYG